MFEIGLNTILLTAAQKQSVGYQEKVDLYRQNRYLVHLAYYSQYYVISEVPVPSSVMDRNTQTSLVDTLHALYIRTRQYRAKVRL